MSVMVLDEREIEQVLAERRQRGADRWDEMWDGVLHMVPPPGAEHQSLTTFLGHVYWEAVVEGKLGKVLTQGKLSRTGPELNDYRVPDLAVVLRGGTGRVVRQGVAHSADHVVEIRSREDETYKKLPYYAKLGVRELLIISCEAKQVELYQLQAGSYALAAKSPNQVASGLLPIAFQVMRRGRAASLELRHTATGKTWSYPP
jgi:Uma2 family endonuclease